MDYIGAKHKLLDWIFDHLRRHMVRLGMDHSQSKFLDGCTGTGAVAVRAAQEGFPVVATDLMHFPQHLVRGKAGLPPEKYERAFDLLADINRNLHHGVEGFFWRHFSPKAKRLFFTEENARRIDAAREAIFAEPDEDIRSYLLYCLIEAVSRVSNTAGTHGAFMKQWKERANYPLILSKESTNYYPGVVARQSDVLDVVGKVGEAVLYLDPPYTKRQYSPNYHLYEQVVAKDPIEIRDYNQTKTGLPENYVRSDFCKGAEEVGALIEGILTSTQARLVLVSYSSDGTVSFDDMATRLMRGFNHRAVEVQVREYGRYRSAESGTSKDLSQDYLREYLFIIERSDDGVFALWS